MADRSAPPATHPTPTLTHMTPASNPATTQSDKAARFLALHRPGTPLLMPNAWDIGSAKLFANLPVEAIATTSGGFAATRGKLDGAMTRAEVLTHCFELAGAVDIPVSADLENCFADDPDGVAATITEAIGTGLAGGSVEDFTGNADDPIYELAHAADRVRAAAEAAHSGPVHFVLTARAENYLHGRLDLADTINRLEAYQEAGADVLFAPRVVEPKDLKQLMSAVDVPVSVLVTPDAPNTSVLAELGVARLSVGGAVAVAAYGYALQAVTELRDDGTAGYWALAGAARPGIQASFTR
jgi:2-methylisocitrate lyase-like PEP mutase family enzyme